MTRLTIRIDENEYDYAKCFNCGDITSIHWESCDQCSAALDEELLNRLGYLEDAIESGNLVFKDKEASPDDPS